MRCLKPRNSAKSAAHGFASGAMIDIKMRYYTCCTQSYNTVPSIHLLPSNHKPLGCSQATCAGTIAEMSNKAMADDGDEELGTASRAQNRWFSGTESLQLMLEHFYISGGRLQAT